MGKIQLKKMPYSIIGTLDHNVRSILMELKMPFEKEENGYFYVPLKLIMEMIYKVNSSLKGYFEKGDFDLERSWPFHKSDCKLC